jgi:hypothetical protein
MSPLVCTHVHTAEEREVDTPAYIRGLGKEAAALLPLFEPFTALQVWRRAPRAARRAAPVGRARRPHASFPGTRSLAASACDALGGFMLANEILAFELALSVGLRGSARRADGRAAAVPTTIHTTRPKTPARDSKTVPRRQSR